MPKWLSHEPPAWAEFIRVALLCLMGFSIVHVTMEQFAGIMLVVSTGLTLIVRQTVTPNDKVRARKKS